jgi:hypothetical protein
LILGNELLTGELVKLTAIQKSDVPDLAEWQNGKNFGLSHPQTTPFERWW